jgi:hypothetical protein
MDCLVRNMNGLWKRLRNIINYFYYLKVSMTNNLYPYKLIGQKFDRKDNTSRIIYKISGIHLNQVSELQKIICDFNVLEKFHPLDALKMGEIAFSDTIYLLPEKSRSKKYFETCDSMIYLFNGFYFKNINSNKYVCENKNQNIYDNFFIENTYICKFVDAKLHHSNFEEIKIIFTIYGQRHGHEIFLKDLIHDEKLLSHFHPADTVKLGYLSGGKRLFYLAG